VLLTFFYSFIANILLYYFATTILFPFVKVTFFAPLTEIIFAFLLVKNCCACCGNSTKGTLTVTFIDCPVGKDGSTAVIPADKADDKSKDADGVKDPSVTPVVDPSNLTEAEKAKVAEAVKKSNPTATDVKVGKDGTTTVTFPDGTTAVIPADKAVTSAEQSSHGVAPAGKAVTSAEQGSNAATPAKKAGAKELPNTGTADSTVAMVAAAASALLGLGLAGRRRKEDEEA